MLEIVLSVLGALGGGALIIGGFAQWLGNLWAKRLVQSEKDKLDQEMESHKIKLKKSEFIFEKEYEAASEFVAFLRSILPRHSCPDMDWYEACDYIAGNFGKIEHQLNKFLATHGAVLTDEIVALLVESLAIAGEGQFDVSSGPIPDAANTAANALYGKLRLVEQKLLENLRGQVRT